MIITNKAEAPLPPNQSKSPGGNAMCGGGENPPKGGGPSYRVPPGQDGQDGPMGPPGPP